MQQVTKVSLLPKRTGVDLTAGILKFMLVQLLVVPVALQSADYICLTNHGTLTITGYAGSGGAVNLPGRMANTITNIGTFAFGFCSGLSCVTIPGSLCGIGDFMFYHCTNLIHVAIGSGITNISSHMFDGCGNLRSITIPSSITSIEDYAFSYCSSLTAVYCKGDAPLVKAPVFDADENVVVYYWPGSCGWSCSPAGCSTMPWNLQIQACDFISRVEFGFSITGPNNLPVVVEACTNLANPIWCPLQTIYISGGTAYFSDPRSRNYPTRFYRIRTP